MDEALQQLAVYPLIWYQIDVLRLKLAILTRQHNDITEVQKKMQSILNEIEMLLGDAPVQAEWQQFLAQNTHL